VLALAGQVADALSAAHKAGLVHRDLKPGNIMVSPSGHVKVLDFGLAKLTELAHVHDDLTVTSRPSTEEGTILGTVSYMSPEQAEGKPVDARSDIFSFGIILYETLSGRRPFTGESKISTLASILNQGPPPLNGEVPPEFLSLIERCLRKDLARRLQHMDDIR